jgi:hypothetical protein
MQTLIAEATENAVGRIWDRGQDRLQTNMVKSPQCLYAFLLGSAFIASSAVNTCG